MTNKLKQCTSCSKTATRKQLFIAGVLMGILIVGAFAFGFIWLDRQDMKRNYDKGYRDGYAELQIKNDTLFQEEFDNATLEEKFEMFREALMERPIEVEFDLDEIDSKTMIIKFF